MWDPRKKTVHTSNDGLWSSPFLNPKGTGKHSNVTQELAPSLVATQCPPRAFFSRSRLNNTRKEKSFLVSNIPKAVNNQAEWEFKGKDSRGPAPTMGFRKKQSRSSWGFELIRKVLQEGSGLACTLVNQDP